MNESDTTLLAELAQFSSPQANLAEFNFVEFIIEFVKDLDATKSFYQEQKCLLAMTFFRLPLVAWISSANEIIDFGHHKCDAVN